MTQVGFCVISRWPLTGFLSNNKKHSYNSYSIYIAIFSSFLQAVYPVGVTDLRPYFTQTIGHNSVNVHRIPTKRGTAIRLKEPFKCTNFHPNWRTYSRFMADFAKCAKRRNIVEEKNKEKTQTLAALISEMAVVIFFKFGMWTALPSRHFCSNFGFNRIRNHECENSVYFLPVNVLTAWRAGFLGRTTHYRVP